MIKAKMYLEAIIPNTWGGSSAVFRANYDSTIPEDKAFQKATPTGDARFTIDNPKALEKLVIGGYYYFDIYPADARTKGIVDKEARVREVRDHINAGGSVELVTDDDGSSEPTIAPR